MVQVNRNFFGAQTNTKQLLRKNLEVNDVKNEGATTIQEIMASLKNGRISVAEFKKQALELGATGYKETKRGNNTEITFKLNNVNYTVSSTNTQQSNARVAVEDDDLSELLKDIESCDKILDDFKNSIVDIAKELATSFANGQKTDTDIQKELTALGANITFLSNETSDRGVIYTIDGKRYYVSNTFDKYKLPDKPNMSSENLTTKRGYETKLQELCAKKSLLGSHLYYTAGNGPLTGKNAFVGSVDFDWSGGDNNTFTGSLVQHTMNSSAVQEQLKLSKERNEMEVEYMQVSAEYDKLYAEYQKLFR